MEREILLTSLLLTSLVLAPLPYFEKSIKERSYTGRLVLKAAPFMYKGFASIFPALNAGNRNEGLTKA